ncbi:MAG: two-component sensor histidine kinase, partial [Alkalispirochaetaceae bacterium]
DNGEGLPEGFLRPLNEGRLPQEIEPGRTGRRGIGLKICLTLAEHLGGRLQFANCGGLEVVLSLPRS